MKEIKFDSHQGRVYIGVDGKYKSLSPERATTIAMTLLKHIDIANGYKEWLAGDVPQLRTLPKRQLTCMTCSYKWRSEAQSNSVRCPKCNTHMKRKTNSAAKTGE